MSDPKRVDCETHGSAFQTYVCEHLVRNPVQNWFSSAPSIDNQWPDSWCSICHEAYIREGQWNKKNEGSLNIKLLCHQCYEAHRSRGSCIDVPDYEIPD